MLSAAKTISTYSISTILTGEGENIEEESGAVEEFFIFGSEEITTQKDTRFFVKIATKQNI
ncbi:MAG: hypothetical protein KAV87_14745 [Desulfobacteraceae bacterium]|nr:hypothetical protein [Desulfobacteraceae bacterium]